MHSTRAGFLYTV